jgi:hypothetical protein
VVERICIIGGGNIGMALAVELGQNIEAQIIILTSKSNIFSRKLISVDPIENTTLSSDIFLITDDYDDALRDIDLLFVTVPAFLVADVIKRIKLEKKTIICFVPGTGGREFHCEKLINQGHVIVGMDRAPFVARIIEEGKSVMVSKKKQIRIAAVGNKNYHDIAGFFQKILNITCLPLNNYLAVTLTPSNPILHTSRLYSMFFGKEIDSVFDKQIKFYAEWDDSASSYLFAADAEVQNICRNYKPINLSEVISLKTHYESNTIQDLTRKMKSIESLSKINSPLIFESGKYIIDRHSRYFIEDFPFGLCVIKAFAVIVGVNTPTIDVILRWFECSFHVNYFVDNSFTGKDLKKISIPQNFGITSINDVINYYV